MSVTSLLFDRWKQLKGVESDSEGARLLGVSHGTPHQWRNGKNAKAHLLEAMCKETGDDLTAMILAALAEQETKDFEARATLNKLARRIAKSVFAIAIATSLAASPSIHYAKCQIRQRATK